MKTLPEYVEVSSGRSGQQRPLRCSEQISEFALVQAAVVGHGVPMNIAVQCARQTWKSLIESGRATPWQVSRLEAYFWACVRTVNRRSESRDLNLSARFLINSVIGDLRSGGLSDKEIVRELIDGWSDRVPPEVMSHYLSQLDSGERRVNVRVAT